jgi:quinol monooxygenase YgiN
MLDNLKKLLPAVDDEPGTLQYVFSFPDDDPDTIWAFEMYADDDALATHSSSPAMAELIGSFGDVMGDTPPMMVKCTVVAGKGL